MRDGGWRQTIVRTAVGGEWVEEGELVLITRVASADV